MHKYRMIKPQDLDTAIKNGGTIIDVRTHLEHSSKHLAKEHIHIPMDAVSGEFLNKKFKISPESPIYILCLGGKRAAVVASQLSDEGFSNLFVIDGGINACESCGHQIIDAT